jgi:thiol-disulfide isomerase/thioredoxin
MRIVLLLVLLVCAACGTTSTTTTTEGSSGTMLTPMPAYDFTMDTLSGGTFTLSSMRGRWVILNFWATWCAPCLDEMPALQAIANERSGQLALFGINMREGAIEIRTYMARYRLSFPILINPDESVSNNYQLSLGIPQTVIITPDGRMVWHKFGAIGLANFRATLDELMAQYA